MNVNKTHSVTKVTMKQLLEFEVAFPDEQPLTPTQYLAGGSRDFILNIASYFLGANPNNSKYNNNIVTLQTIFSVENDDIVELIKNRIKEAERAGTGINIISVVSSLKLFEYFFAKPEEPVTQSNADFEINFFKAYLVFNSEYEREKIVATSSTEGLDNKLQFPLWLFCNFYQEADKTNYSISKIWTTQLIKARMLFEFLESNSNTKPLLTAFLVNFECTTWQDYMKRLLPLTNPALANKNESHSDIEIQKGDEYIRNCSFIEKLIVQENDPLEENDFLSLRAKPFYKVSEGVYRIIYNLFVVEKVFKGAYFLLRNVNDLLPVQHKLPNLRSIYCHQFSEQTLLYKILDIIYPDNCIKFSGQHLADLKIDGAPDYYIRKDKDILLFESKDFLINAAAKASFDYSIYEEEFGKRLYYEIMPDGKEKPGAVMQLINSIRKILKNEFKPDADYYYKEVIIYPVLITHDHQYDAIGFNFFINEWFQDELRILQKEGFYIHHIKPLVVVNIDSLIFHESVLTENIPLHQMLLEYEKVIHFKPHIKFKTKEEFQNYRMKTLIPFSVFINNHINDKGLINKHPLLEAITYAIFPDDERKNAPIATLASQ